LRDVQTVAGAKRCPQRPQPPAHPPRAWPPPWLTVPMFF